MSIGLRAATIADAASVADVLIDSRRDAEPAVPASVHPPEETRSWVREHLMFECDVQVATDGTSLVGVMAQRGEWVEQLYIRREWARRGVGSRLLDRAKSSSPTGLQLWTFVSNAPARAFYERHGFVVAEETDGSGNEEGQPDVRMVWRP